MEELLQAQERVAQLEAELQAALAQAAEHQDEVAGLKIQLEGLQVGSLWLGCMDRVCIARYFLVLAKVRRQAQSLKVCTWPCCSARPRWLACLCTSPSLRQWQNA